MEIKTITTDVLIIGSRKGSIDCFKRIDFQIRLYWNG